MHGNIKSNINLVYEPGNITHILRSALSLLLSQPGLPTARGKGWPEESVLNEKKICVTSG